ncbi:hypothetical protein NDU88_004686 [Pleurodeles waltl]|uniref:Uncharacterized protein n=1 Tax=Pleurodeles waltl TaxID=8319 RepID=A0AAV7MAR4_PLEWA|nr:hypothetical protein NDU88_004686 [Pleurodeles waltl]
MPGRLWHGQSKTEYTVTTAGMQGTPQEQASAPSPAPDLEQIIAEGRQALKKAAALMAMPRCSSPELEKIQLADEESSVAMWPSGNDLLYPLHITPQTAEIII